MNSNLSKFVTNMPRMYQQDNRGRSDKFLDNYALSKPPVWPGQLIIS